MNAADRLTEQDIYLFREGSHARLYQKFGAHPAEHDGAAGVAFALWAPNAAYVSVIGDFNGWNTDADPLTARADQSGVWQGFVAGLESGAVYKYHIRSRARDYRVDKADPFGFRAEVAPRTASIVATLDYDWQDGDWMRDRAGANALDAPQSIYELHLGSWRRDPADPERLPGYRELAEPLADYVVAMGFTHVELMPLTEHPFYGSWGYQTTGYFAASSRYGPPQDLMYLIDVLHRRGVGVILDWVPSHFPSDLHGLHYFDGTHLYEHADPRQGYHPEWNSYIFNYGRNEVRAFLLSSALFWLDHYHIDGLRVDAVASMLYLDYARDDGQWVPNERGGRENDAAIHFLQRLNEAVYRDYPDVQTIAEESTAWPQVSRPTASGGLGFGLKWNMGWMHDTLKYVANDPVHRSHHHGQLTFSLIYAFNENFVLPFSHDEVVHGKGSLIGKMPGDDWQRFANLRLLYGHMFGHPGKKLLFMGAELAQRAEWNHDRSLDWHLLDDPGHLGVQHWLADLNRVYRDHPALHRRDFSGDGFVWCDADDWRQSTLSYVRQDGEEDPAPVLVVVNFTPVVRPDHRVGVPRAGRWRQILNSDDPRYGGSGVGGVALAASEPVAQRGMPQSLTLTLPPLAACFYLYQDQHDCSIEESK